jgi:hypothetical protein
MLRIALMGTVIFFSVTSLFSLLIYLFLTVFKRALLLRLNDSADIGGRVQQAFLLMAGLGWFCVCIAGVTSMLFWVPSSWGWRGEDGDWTTIQNYVGFCIGMVLGGLGLMVVEALSQSERSRRSRTEFVDRG